MKNGGFSNYATYRVNVDILNGLELAEMVNPDIDVDGLEDLLMEIVENAVLATNPKGLAKDFATLFIQSVNYRELAELYINDIVSTLDG